MANYLVTGSNRGIGLEYCRQLKAKGHNVIATCRTTSAELERLDVSVYKNIDVTDHCSIKGLRDSLARIKVDVLILNAGVLEKNSFLDLDVNSIRKQFEVNALAPLFLIRTMIDNLESGSKIIIMTSRMGSISDNRSGGSYGYRMSKAALCMSGKSLAIDLEPLGISVALLHPGLVKTDMTNFTQDGIEPSKSVEGLLKLIDSLDIKNSGSFWHSNGEILPW